MKVTSAEANKLLRKLNDDHDALKRMEAESRIFVAATTENLEDARPDYDYEATQRSLAELEIRIRKLKHTINLFNVSQTIDESGMTIDQALIAIPQLSDRKRKLSVMRAAQKKKRNENTRSTNLIEYTYANYDVEEAKAAADAAAEELARAQTALDKVNNTETMEIDL